MLKEQVLQKQRDLLLRYIDPGSVSKDDAPSSPPLNQETASTTVAASQEQALTRLQIYHQVHHHVKRLQNHLPASVHKEKPLDALKFTSDNGMQSVQFYCIHPLTLSLEIYQSNGFTSTCFGVYWLDSVNFTHLIMI